MQQAVGSLARFFPGSLSTPIITMTDLSAQVRLDVAANENYTIALNTAYNLLRLLQNVTTLNSALRAAGLGQDVTIELVRIQFFHPDEGLVIVEFAPPPELEDSTASQVVASDTAEAVAALTAAVTAAVATAVAVAVAGAVGGAVAGAAGGGAAGGGAGGAGGGGGGGGGGAGGVFPLMMGAQRMEMSAGLAVEKDEMQTGVAGTQADRTVRPYSHCP